MILQYKPVEGETKASLRSYLSNLCDTVKSMFPDEKIVVVCARGDLCVVEGDISLIVVDGETYTVDQTVEAIRAKIEERK